ncbi:adenosylmethionine-8-amino-7-oxononanoateaminotr ansferase [Ferrimonas balearica DSM 9799]|uniref:Adenosylmethionine-8-amino-7-oxononanoate aminotransferase n=1 Tax=Ferrimonas balearica (strain DSM 9799 / CCM 4581 / KCTC 23876 / PAT) TaxID=550540 RepID=E1SMN8_FERBD|nr:adenosylmethionine--8-amino-7-oxononanoate transaminase [Ferrimonas balearica]ADN75577.1 adenosylmethionine-8-amino-7-oxononanoateaminotr ansferase [Ferrimonas balearica DSM 9799]
MKADLQFDRDHLWHPYTSTTHPLPCYPVARAEGVHIELESGERLIDGMSSWWSTIHGYSHPVLVNAAKAQLDRMSHVMFGGLTHGPATALGQRLVAMTHPSLTKVFLADSGSVSVEVALKMALQYQQGCGRRDKTGLMTILGGYHGDTFAAMSVCDPVNGMHGLFRDILPKAQFLPRPQTGLGEPLHPEDRAAIDAAMAEHAARTAAVIVEPMVQGAGGMRFYGAAYLDALREACDRHNIVLIFDEIATGFGRTGELFAYQHSNVVPDILCLGKALTGGTMTLAATLASDAIAEGVCASEAGVFMHGPTFMGNPLACAVAEASMGLLASGDWQAQVRQIEAQLQTELSPCRALSSVADVRVFGAIGVVETTTAVDVAAIQKRFVADGVWIRPFGKLVYIMPPYIITPEQLTRLTGAIYRALS